MKHLSKIQQQTLEQLGIRRWTVSEQGKQHLASATIENDGELQYQPADSEPGKVEQTENALTNQTTVPDDAPTEVAATTQVDAVYLAFEMSMPLLKSRSKSLCFLKAANCSVV